MPFTPPDSHCYLDMEQVDRWVTDIRSAITKVQSLLGPDTWSGAAADAWAKDFSGRMYLLNMFFDNDLADEEKRLVAANSSAPPKVRPLMD
jgi:hypothetical protein